MMCKLLLSLLVTLMNTSHVSHTPHSEPKIEFCYKDSTFTSKQERVQVMATRAGPAGPTAARQMLRQRKGYLEFVV